VVVAQAEVVAVEGSGPAADGDPVAVDGNIADDVSAVASDLDQFGGESV
jgi:hypothetical protein